MKSNLVPIRKGVMSGRNWRGQDAPNKRHPMAAWDVPVHFAEECSGDVTADLIGVVSWGPKIEFRTLLFVRLVRCYATAHGGGGETPALLVEDVADAIRCLSVLQKTFRRGTKRLSQEIAQAECEVATLRHEHFPGIIPGSNEPMQVRPRTHPRENEAAFHQVGATLVRVYANERRGGRVVFKVELVQLEPRADGEVESILVGLDDLPDAIRCLTWARSWIEDEGPRWGQTKQ